MKSTGRQIFLLLFLAGLFFSPQARAQQYAAPPVFYNGKIIPTPQEVTYSDTFIPISASGQEKRTTAVCVDKERQKDAAAVDLIQIFAKAGASVDLITDMKDAGQYTAVVMLGKQNDTDELLKQKNLSLPEHREGYIIYPFKEKNRWVVLALGNNKTGDYWAIQTIRQILCREGDTIKMQAAQVTDFPSFRWRGELGANPETWCFLAYKFNFGPMWGGQWDWRNPTDKDKERIQKTCTYFKDRGFSALLAVNPIREREKIPRIMISNDTDVAKLVDYFRTALAAGGGVSLHLDDHAFPTPKEDMDRFGSSAKAHAYLIEQIYNLRKNYPDFPFFFCPPFYATDLGGFYKKYGEDGGTYYKEFKVPEDINLYWTGAGVTSQGCRTESITRWKSIIGRSPIFWDNWCQYGFPMAPKDFPKFYPDFYKEMDGYMMGYNAGNNRAVGMATLADYLWNPQQYEPEKSLQNAVEQILGPGMYPPYSKWVAQTDLLRRTFNRMTGWPYLPPLCNVQLISLNKKTYCLAAGMHRNMFYFYRRAAGKTGIEWEPDVWAIKSDKETDMGNPAVFNLADMDGDGVPELLLACPDGTINLYKHDASAVHPAWKQHGTLTGEIPKKQVSNLCAGDFNGDGSIDLFVSFVGEKDIRGYSCTGGKWQENSTLLSGLDMAGIAQPYISAYDIDSDRRIDMVIGSADGSTAVFLNKGNTAPMWEKAPSMTDGVSPVPVLASPAMGDIDGDGCPELIIANAYGSMTGYRKQKTGKWRQDITLVPQEAREPGPDVFKMLAEMEAISKQITSSAGDNPVAKAVETNTSKQRKWAEDNIFQRTRRSK